MKSFAILLTLGIAICLTGCSKEEPAATPNPVVQPAPKTAPLTNAAEEAKQIIKQTTDKVAQVAQQVEESAVAAVEQVKQASNISGQMVYTKACLACHKFGLSGAPKTGDKNAWSARLANGMDQLVKNAINGIGSMAPKGGSSKLTDDEVKAAVEYMLEQSR